MMGAFSKTKIALTAAKILTKAAVAYMDENRAPSDAQQNDSQEIIRARQIVKKYFIGTENELTVLKSVDVTVYKGEFVSIVGPSGSGKSTMMQILGALDKPTSGSYWLDGILTDEMSRNELSDARNAKIGFVFQTYNLIARSSAQKNVELPMLYAGMSRAKRTARAKELLEMVGMGDRMGHQPNELSGGQKQRVAIARAMANDPAIILADEPTGALDSKTGRQVMDIFHEIHKRGATVILITHNAELAAETQRIFTLRDGEIVSIVDNARDPDSLYARCYAPGATEKPSEYGAKAGDDA